MFLLNLLNSASNLFVMTVRGLEPATSCVRDQDDSTAPARYIWEKGSLNWAQFIFQYLSDSLNSLNHWIPVPFRENSISLMCPDDLLSLTVSSPTNALKWVLLNVLLDVLLSEWTILTSCFLISNIIHHHINHEKSTGSNYSRMPTARFLTGHAS